MSGEDFDRYYSWCCDNSKYITIVGIKAVLKAYLNEKK